MKILLLNGSTRTGSTNQRLLDFISKKIEGHQFHFFELDKLPLFHPDEQTGPFVKSVQLFKKAIVDADAVIISTPAYLHNIPAVLKNALELLASVGELNEKKVLPITYTPNNPRGEKAMQSLLWSLTALNARPVTTLEIDHTEISFDEKGNIQNDKGLEVLLEAIQLLK